MTEREILQAAWDATADGEGYRLPPYPSDRPWRTWARGALTTAGYAETRVSAADRARWWVRAGVVRPPGPPLLGNELALAQAGLPQALPTAPTAEQLRAFDDPIQAVSSLQAECQAILERCRFRADDALALKAVDRAAELIRLRAELAGEIQASQTTVNVVAGVGAVDAFIAELQRRIGGRVAAETEREPEREPAIPEGGRPA